MASESAQAPPQPEDSIRDFLMRLSHELTGTLASLSIQIEFLEAVSKKGGSLKTFSEQLGYLREQADYLQYLVNDLRFHFAWDPSSSSDRARKVDLLPIIIRVQRILLPTARMDKSIDIKISIAGLPRLTLDPRKIEQVLFNVLHNAVKYSKRDGGDVAIRYSLIHEENADTTKTWHRLSIANYGVGVESDDVERVFHQYCRGRNAALAPSGTGLGLAVSKRIVESYGGRILITRRADPTVFSIDLPAALAESASDS